jgi:hypothetical protein
VIGGVLIVSLTLLVTPNILSFFYINLGGSLLQKAYNPFSQFHTGGFYCSSIIDLDNKQHEMINQAIIDLNKGLSYNRDNTYVRLLLGRAYCIIGEYENAVQSLQFYIDNKPDNPIGYIEIALAYQNICFGQIKHTGHGPTKEGNGEFQSICDNNNLSDLYKHTLRLAGINEIYSMDNVQDLFAAQDFSNVAMTYFYNYLSDQNFLEKLSYQDKFIWTVSSILSSDFIPKIFYSEIPIYKVNNNNIKIEAEALRWLRSIPEWDIHIGDSLYQDTGSDMGVFFWNGRAAVPINVLETGNYRIIIRGKNTFPGPVLMNLEIDNNIVSNFGFDREDDSLQEIVINASLNSGLHILGLQFTNNGIDRNADRNARLDWITLEQVK